MDFRFEKEIGSLIMFPDHFYRNQGTIFSILSEKKYTEASISTIAQLFCASPELYKTLGTLLLFFDDKEVMLSLKPNLSEGQIFYLERLIDSANYGLVRASLDVHNRYKSGLLHDGYRLTTKELSHVRNSPYKPMYTSEELFPQFRFINTDIAIQPVKDDSSKIVRFDCEEALSQIVVCSPMLLKYLMMLVEHVTENDFYKIIEQSLSKEELNRFDTIIKRARFTLTYVDNFDSKYESHFLNMIDEHIRLGLSLQKESLKDGLYNVMYKGLLKGDYKSEEITLAIDEILSCTECDILTNYQTDGESLPDKIVQNFILFDDFLDHWL